MKSRPTVYILLMAALVVGGCNAQRSSKPNYYSPNKASVVEDLLEKEGRWHIVEHEEAFDPVKQHMRARRQVDPGDMSKYHHYARRKPVPDERERFRVLRIAGADDGFFDGFKSLIPKRKPKMGQKAVLTSVTVPKHKPEQFLQKEASKVLESENVNVTGVRMGEHPGKTRLVLDLDGKASFNYTLDNSKNLLLIDLPGAGWRAENSKKVFGGHPLIQAYMVKSSPNGGTLLAVRMKHTAKVIMGSAFKPNEVHGHRIVFDVAKADATS